MPCIFKKSQVRDKELRVFIASQGGIVEICKRIGIDAETLSNMFSNEDAPRLLGTFSSLLNTLEHRIAIEGTHAKHLSLPKQIPTTQ